jgi:hypothetical protein
MTRDLPLLKRTANDAGTHCCYQLTSKLNDVALASSLKNPYLHLPPHRCMSIREHNGNFKNEFHQQYIMAYKTPCEGGIYWIPNPSQGRPVFLSSWFCSHDEGGENGKKHH